jgi:hypothetical protein
MKTKLLKKVRKRFEIFHLPKGFTSFGNRYKYNLFKLTDSTNKFYEHYAQLKFDGSKEKQFCYSAQIFNSEKECINYLKSEIIYRLRKEGNRGAKDKKIENSEKKVWHI